MTCKSQGRWDKRTGRMTMIPLCYLVPPLFPTTSLDNRSLFKVHQKSQFNHLPAFSFPTNQDLLGLCAWPTNCAVGDGKAGPDGDPATLCL